MPQAWNPSGNDHLIRFDSGGRRLLVEVHHYFLLALSIGFGLSAVRSDRRLGRHSSLYSIVLITLYSLSQFAVSK